jgi:hypothetical protein
VQSPGRDLVGTVIINSDEIRPSILPVMADRTVLTHQPKSIGLQESDHLVEGQGHTSCGVVLFGFNSSRDDEDGRTFPRLSVGQVDLAGMGHQYAFSPVHESRAFRASLDQAICS